ncbi:MAG: 30S ribosomal protein S21 [Thermonemataceae bacterium]
MISVQVKENESIEKALKRFKKKFEKAGVLKEVRGRAFFEKKSVSRRRTVLRAAYRQKMKAEQEKS